jgi:HEAT repeat protein
VRIIPIIIAILGSLLVAGMAFAENPFAAHNAATAQAILKAASESNRDVRARVAWVCGNMNHADGRKVLDTLAGDSAPEVRAAALRAMHKLLPIGSKISVELASPIKNDLLRHGALVAADRLIFAQRHQVILDGLKSDLVGERTLAVRALVLDPPDVEHEALEDYGQPAVFAEWLRTLGKRKDKSLAPLARRVLSNSRDGDILIRGAACEALALAGDQSGNAELMRTASDKHYFVRRSAISALGALKVSSAIHLIKRAAKDRDLTVRMATCRAFGIMRDPVGAEALVRTLVDDAPEVGDVAFESLGKYSADMACPTLLKYVGGMPHANRRRASIARTRIWHLLAGYSHASARKAAAEHVGDKNSSVRASSYHILRMLGDVRLKRIVARKLTPSGLKGGLSDVETKELFKAAALFKMLEPRPSASYAIKWANPGNVLEPPYMPSEDILREVAEYVAAIKDKRLAKQMASLFGERSVIGYDLAVRVAAIIKDITGTSPKHPPKPVLRKPFTSYFLDVKEKAR